MTLIVGVICRDGVVIGADSVATTVTSVEQQVSDKITIDEDNVIIACSGSAGLSQLIKEELSGRWHEFKQLRYARDARNAISDSMYSQIQPAAERAKSTGRTFGGCEILVAMAIDHRPTLFQFNARADSIEITSEFPFVSIGSGSNKADPFLAFVKRILWSDEAPNSTRLGIFGVLWTLQHVSTVSPILGVGEPHWIVVLERQGTHWMATKLGKGELLEHRQAIVEAEDALRRFGEGSNSALPSAV